jgi:hypothetical protein
VGVVAALTRSPEANPTAVLLTDRLPTRKERNTVLLLVARTTAVATATATDALRSITDHPSEEAGKPSSDQAAVIATFDPAQ